jgi:hypothetical protein
VNFFSAFAASFGSMLLVAALIASWLFRSSAAPLIAKIAVPALIVALACAAPYQVNAMLGFPTTALPATLPARTMTTNEWIYGYVRATPRPAPMRPR